MYIYIYIHAYTYTYIYTGKFTYIYIHEHIDMHVYLPCGGSLIRTTLSLPAVVRKAALRGVARGGSGGVVSVAQRIRACFAQVLSC